MEATRPLRATRYKTRAEIKRERLAAGLCDTCGGPAMNLRMGTKDVRVCKTGECGFHEVGVEDGARFSNRAPGARAWPGFTAA